MHTTDVPACVQPALLRDGSNVVPDDNGPCEIFTPLNRPEPRFCAVRTYSAIASRLLPMVSARENPNDGADADALLEDDEEPDAGVNVAENVVALEEEVSALPIEGKPLA